MTGKDRAQSRPDESLTEDDFDPTCTPGAHKWFAHAVADQETAEGPIVWADRPDIFWCAGLAGGCDTWHRADYPHVDAIADDLPVTVCVVAVRRAEGKHPEPQCCTDGFTSRGEQHNADCDTPPRRHRPMRIEP